MICCSLWQNASHLHLETDTEAAVNLLHCIRVWPHSVCTASTCLHTPRCHVYLLCRRTDPALSHNAAIVTSINRAACPHILTVLDHLELWVWEREWYQVSCLKIIVNIETSLLKHRRDRKTETTPVCLQCAAFQPGVRERQVTRWLMRRLRRGFPRGIFTHITLPGMMKTNRKYSETVFWATLRE